MPQVTTDPAVRHGRQHPGGLYAWDATHVGCWTCEQRRTDGERSLIRSEHDCMDYGQHYLTDGPLGDAYDCGRCGAFIQVG